MLLIPPKITPAGLHLAVVAILDEFLQGLLSVFGAVGVLVVLDGFAVIDAFIGF